jgi:anti-anti-sigma regulatory factor
MSTDGSSEEIKVLQFLISAKENYLVVSFVGPMNRDSSHIIDDCLKAVLATNAKFVVLNFRDVSRIEHPFIPQLIKLQTEIREGKREIRTTSLRPEFRNVLLDKGAIRFNELTNNLTEALLSFSVKFA